MSSSLRTAFVTGASRGIGKAITQKLLDDDFKVIGTTRNTPWPNAFSAHKHFSGIRVDFSSPEEVHEVIKPFIDKQSPDVIINNAGIFLEAPIQQGDDDWLQAWDRTQQVNLRTPALICKWALQKWTSGEASNGVIINISSRAGYRGDTQEYTAYAASKAGLIAFTKSIARDFGTHNIAAYSIAPGFIKTDMAMESIDVYGEEYLTQGSAFNEITSPDEVAELVSFLARGTVKHMTGSTFHINGGSYMV